MINAEGNAVDAARLTDIGADPVQTGIAVATSPWPEVARRLQNGALAVLPIGAASKEHGYHLPLATDWLQAEWLATRICGLRRVVAWPTLNYGYYPVFVDYPGSISLSEPTFRAVVREILVGISRAGARRIAVLNTGISTITPLQEVLNERATEAGVELVNVYAGPRFSAARTDLETQAYGGHADEIESSIMLALAPRWVDMRCAVGNTRRIERGLFNRDDPGSPNYAPSGVNGDPRPATAHAGVRLLDAMLADTLAALDTCMSRGDG